MSMTDDDKAQADLKPCPFCGGKADLKNQHYTGTGASGMETPWPFVSCNECGVRSVPVECDNSSYGQRTKAKTYRQALEMTVIAWNTRADDANIAVLSAENERLREALKGKK